MKKFIALLMLIAFTAIAAFTQESSTYDYEMKLKSDLYGGTYAAIELADVDSIGVGDSVWYFTVKKLTTNKVFPDFRVVLDSTGGTADSVLVSFKYKSWLKDPWTTLTTVKYYGSADTAFNYTYGTALIADYWQVHVKGYSDDFKVNIDSLYFKFVY